MSSAHPKAVELMSAHSIALCILVLTFTCGLDVGLRQAQVGELGLAAEVVQAVVGHVFAGLQASADVGDAQAGAGAEGCMAWSVGACSDWFYVCTWVTCWGYRHAGGC